MKRSGQSRRRRQRHREQQKKPNPVPPSLPGGWYKLRKDPDVKRLHEASLDVLERIGIEVQPSECREIFRRAGARVDESVSRV